MALTCYQVLLALGMLVSGSINTLSKKAQNDVNVEGVPLKNGTAIPHNFDHPWFQTVIMFIGESFCLVGLLAHRYRERIQRRKEYLKQMGADAAVPKIEQPRIFSFIFAIPCTMDLIGTSLAAVGLLYVSASVWQMLRGSIIIFTGVLSKIFLKRKLRMVHWSGMIVTVLGLVLVGMASVLQQESQKGKDAKAVLGIIMILAGQVVSASQMIVEELFLKKRNFHPLQVVGMEGSFGFLIISFIVLPIMYYIPGPQVGNSYENSLDALYQIYNSPRLLAFCLLYLSSIAFYNYFGLAVTKSLTAVHRTLIDACRTILVWIVDLIIYYAFDKNFGEPFNKTYGILQVDGFLFLMIGTALYNELVVMDCIPCLRPPQRELREIERESQANIQSPGGVGEKTPLLHDDLQNDHS